MRVLFTGGGTLGPVTPLLALHEELEGSKDYAAFWIGTRKGPERQLVESVHIPFVPIFAGKLRRYVSLRNLFDPFFSLYGIVQAVYYILYWHPDVIVNAGSYVGVPVIFAGWLLRKRTILFQLDRVPSLSNKITAFFATRIGVASESEKIYFPQKKTQVVGIPVRKSTRQLAGSKGIQYARKTLAVSQKKPLLLVIGGGTGAVGLNTLIFAARESLAHLCYTVHITGFGKMGDVSETPDYKPFAFLRDELGMYVAAADLVVSRAGMGMISELAALGKASILLPLPHSQQEVNAQSLAEKHACIVLNEKTLTPDALVGAIQKVLTDRAMRQSLEKNILDIFPAHAEQSAVHLLLV